VVVAVAVLLGATVPVTVSVRYGVGVLVCTGSVALAVNVGRVLAVGVLVSGARVAVLLSGALALPGDRLALLMMVLEPSGMRKMA